MGNRIVVFWAAEERVDLLQEAFLDGQPLEGAGFGAQLAQDTGIDIARGIRQFDAKSDARYYPRRRLDDLSRIAFGVNVGDVIGNDLQRLLGGLQSADGILKGNF